MKRQGLLLAVFVFLFVHFDLHAASLAKSDKAQEKLKGSVKTLLIEFAKMNLADGKWVPESPRTPWLSTTYDRRGYRIEEEQFYTEKSLDFKSVFHYDPQGELSDGLEYDYQGTVAFKWSYTHDPSTRSIEKRQFFPDGGLFSITTHFYDDQGNLIEEKLFLAQTQNRFKWRYLYDEAGRKIEEAYYLERPGEGPGTVKSLLNFRAVFDYDKEGNMVHETKSDASGKISLNRTFQYEYDQHGNWIAQTAFESAEGAGASALAPTEITYRTIHYYPQ